MNRLALSLGVALGIAASANGDIVSSANGQAVSEVTGSIAITFDNGYTQVFELNQNGDATINNFADGTAQMANMRLVEPFSRESAGSLEIAGFGQYEAEGGFSYDATLTAKTPIGTFMWQMNLRRIGDSVTDPGFGTYLSQDAPIAVRHKNVGVIVEVILQLPPMVDTGVPIAAIAPLPPTSSEQLPVAAFVGGFANVANSQSPGMGGGATVGPPFIPTTTGPTTTTTTTTTTDMPTADTTTTTTTGPGPVVPEPSSVAVWCVLGVGFVVLRGRRLLG